MQRSIGREYLLLLLFSDASIFLHSVVDLVVVGGDGEVKNRFFYLRVSVVRKLRQVTNSSSNLNQKKMRFRNWFHPSSLVLATFVIPLFLLVSSGDGTDSSFTIESVRESLIRQEDSVVFCIIERTNYPFNSPVYQQHLPAGGGGDSMVDSVVKETEAIQSKLGRYESEEENPFFPNMLPPSLEPPRNRPKFLHPAGSLININTIIRDMYLNQLLPLFIPPGDDGNYVQTAASDLHCLQVLSRRIHYGKFVAEVKFRDAPNDYGPAIRDQDRDALTKLLTFKDVEEMVRKRVKKKAMVFGQDVTIGGNNNNNNNSRSYKVDPSVVSRLYKEWVIPLTKRVQVDYLLRRLD